MRRAALTLLVLPVTGAACGASSPTATTSPSCSTTAHNELVAVAHRIYNQAVRGPNEAAAVARVQRSTALARAVAARDPRAIRAALVPVMHDRIVRIDISAGGRTLVREGTAPAYAPVSGSIGDGRYVLSVGDTHSFEAITGGLLGGKVRFGGPGFPATTFPGHRTTVHLTLPTHLPATCTRASIIGQIGRNLVYAETHGASAQMALRHAAKTRTFVRAIAAGDPVALRSAIIGFFRDSRFHIVRVRAWKGNRLIGDVGGPYVISPATARIPGVGRFMLSVQDDTGYIKLMHRFTGADVVLRLNGRIVPGSQLGPGPKNVYRFAAPAFPTGRLQVSLLVP
jgi:hypothetical protein